MLRRNNNPEKQNPGTINMAVARKLWIHCNRCFTHFVNRQSIMFLLACKHVICEKCVAANLGRTPSDAPTYKCPMCQQLVRGRQLGNSMPSNLKDMFHPQPWLDGIHHDVVDTFQRANCDHLDKHLKEKSKKLNKEESDCKLAKESTYKHYMEYRRTRHIRKQLEDRARQIKIQARLREEEELRRSSLAKRRKSPDAAASAALQAIVDGAKKSRSRSHSPAVPLDTISQRHRSPIMRPTITSFEQRANHSFDL